MLYMHISGSMCMHIYSGALCMHIPGICAYACGYICRSVEHMVCCEYSVEVSAYVCGDVHVVCYTCTPMVLCAQYIYMHNVICAHTCEAMHM